MPTPLRLVNPHRGAVGQHRVQADLAKHVYNYLFRGVFRGDPGVKASLICTFFQRLYEECQLHTEIDPTTWDEENEQRIAAIISKLNFRDVEGELNDLLEQRNQLRDELDRAANRPVLGSSDVTRRPSTPASLDQTQSSPPKPKSRTATGVRKKGKGVIGQPTSPNISAET